MKNGFFETALEALEAVKKMPLKEGLAEALQWRSDDFGHRTDLLADAESLAFTYYGEIFLNYLTEMKKSK